MSPVAEVPPPAKKDIGVATSAGRDRCGKSILSLMLLMAAALFATALSLAIAAYAGWQHGGTQAEQVMNVALAGIAVLYLHLLPTRWNAFRLSCRAFAFALWFVSLLVILYGQVTFFMVSQQHAGDQRATTVSVVAPQLSSKPRGRPLTEIAQDIARVSADLARADARRCEGDCPPLKSRRMILLARLAALTTEADEAKRREAEEDRRNGQADRNEALRATLRADPVASTVASWFGTTERRLEFILAVACAIVLEGAAIIGWLLVSIASGRADSREAVASVRKTVAPKREAVVLEDEAVARGPYLASCDRAAQADNSAAVAPGWLGSAAESAGSQAMSGDDHLLTKIRAAVVTGQLKPTQSSIRRYLQCGQQKATRLNRAYLVRFGRA